VLFRSLTIDKVEASNKDEYQSTKAFKRLSQNPEGTVRMLFSSEMSKHNPGNTEVGGFSLG